MPGAVIGVVKDWIRHVDIRHSFNWPLQVLAALLQIIHNSRIIFIKKLKSGESFDMHPLSKVFLSYLFENRDGSTVYGLNFRNVIKNENALLITWKWNDQIKICELECNNVSCNGQPSSVYLARTGYLHSSTSLLDFECPIKKSHTFVALQSTTNTNRIGWARFRIPQIDWSPLRLVHKLWKEIWPSKSTQKTKDSFPMYLSHQPTLEIEKKKKNIDLWTMQNVMNRNVCTQLIEIEKLSKRLISWAYSTKRTQKGNTYTFGWNP